MIWLIIVLGSVAAGRLLGQGDVAANLRAATSLAPELLLLALFGVTLGLYGRDRIRLRKSYASPSLAYSGKLCFVVSFSAAATFILAPVDWPVWWLHGFAAAGAAGAASWIGNLPPRL
jgi:hypothetical protein